MRKRAQRTSSNPEENTKGDLPSEAIEESRSQGCIDDLDESQAEEDAADEDEPVLCMRCGSRITGVEVRGLGDGVKGVWTGIMGQTFTREHGPGEVYLCEPCSVWLIDQCKLGPDHRPCGDD